MAHLSSFPESNHVLDKPANMTYDQCEAASVWTGQLRGDGGEHPAVITCWKITKEELEEINKTGRIWLWIWGNTMPPAYVGIENPFKGD